MLPDPLKPLADYDQFLLYKLVPKTDGKTNKIPIDPRTCRAYEKGSNWQQDPTAVVNYSIVAMLSEQLGPEYGVGFLFTPNDPFFFLDIDNCLIGGDWSPVAYDLMNSLPGAAIEVSQSGTGLHIFGRHTGVAPSHSCKNEPLGLELYTSSRFVALTGSRAVGSASADCTKLLPGVVSRYFGAKQTAEPMDWTTEAVPEYTGPEDDTELIKRMLGTTSAASVFSSTAGVKELWTADEDALGNSYPDQRGRAYDASSADAALAQHLAFWTGKNCERIQRLMRQSALVRDKWDREDYLPRTILRAASLQKDVYSVGGATTVKLKGTPQQVSYAQSIRAKKLVECGNDPDLTSLTGPLKQATFWINNKDLPAAELKEKIKTPDAVTSPFDNISGPEIAAGFQFLGAEQQIELFKGCVYIQEIHRVFTPSGALLKSEQFNATYGGFVFQIDDTAAKTVRKAFEAFTESQVVRYPKAESVCFRPLLAPGTLIRQDGRVLVNTYVPAVVPRKPGDVTPFLKHLELLLPNERDRQIILAYMAACVQHKGHKFQWAPLIQGAEGNGKSLLTRCVAAAIGDKYVHMPPASEIDEKFNAWLFDKLLIGVEDIYVPGQKRGVIEILKPIITGDRLPCRAMQQDQIMRDVCCNFMFNSNHRDAIPVGNDARRFAIFFSAQQSFEDIKRAGMLGDYFPNLYDWLKREDGYAYVTDFLYSYNIPEEFNPAGMCQRAPETSTTHEAIAASMGGVEQEVLEAIDEGRPGFCGGWISSMALDLLLKNKRLDGRILHNKRKELLQSLGYVWHPALKDGRVNNPVAPDNGKPRLFVRSDSPSIILQTAKDVSDAYQKAQTEGIFSNDA